jgi:hypothetical protein
MLPVNAVTSARLPFGKAARNVAPGLRPVSIGRLRCSVGYEIPTYGRIPELIPLGLLSSLYLVTLFLQLWRLAAELNTAMPVFCFEGKPKKSSSCAWRQISFSDLFMPLSKNLTRSRLNVKAPSLIPELKMP